MAQTRYAIVDLRLDPPAVVDIVQVDETIDPETGEPRETMHAHDPYLAVAHKTAEPGWVWSEAKGLRKP